MPTLRIRLYNAVTGGLLLMILMILSLDQSLEPGRNLQTMGVHMVHMIPSDKANETTYIRYAPTSLGDNIKVRALLTQD